MIQKNCANCGTTNTLDAEECIVCHHAEFFAPHAPVGDVDGPKPVDHHETVVIVVAEAAR